MILTLSAMLTLAKACAPTVAPATLLSLTRAESGFDPLVVAVNGSSRRVIHATSRAQAIAVAKSFVDRGLSVDLGLGQLNSRTAARLGVSVGDAFDPCRNLAASARVLAADYRRAAAGDGVQPALRRALSLYNTGDPSRGARNGYVARVVSAARDVVPALAPAAREARPSSPSAAPPPLDVFAAAGRDPVIVF